jgi:L-2-hydroxyglutarate oxidase LhgO
MTGIRPGLRGEGFHDFIIQDESEKGLPGLINLIGIESPGLTAALEIARHIRSLLKEV